jgi:hypothetical protein
MFGHDQLHALPQLVHGHRHVSQLFNTTFLHNIGSIEAALEALKSIRLEESSDSVRMEGWVRRKALLRFLLVRLPASSSHRTRP